MNGKICNKCGKPNELNSSFCTECGNNLTEMTNLKDTNNRKICPKCGKANELLNKSCVYCGISFEENSNGIQMNNNDNGNIYGVIAIVISFLFCFAPIGLIVTIIGKNKYPRNKFLKIAFWIIMIYIIIAILAVIFALLIAMISCNGIEG